MKYIWNLIMGSICLFTVLIDLTFSRIGGITVFNTFAATSNLGVFIYARLNDVLSEDKE